MILLHFFLDGFIIGGIGTCIGGVLSIIISKPNDKLLSCLLSFTSGIMLSIICFDLLLESYKISGMFIQNLGLVFGMVMIFVAESLMPLHKINLHSNKNQNYIKMSMIIIISLSLHNFPEGIALGSSYIYSNDLGLKIALLISVHNIPEGMTIGVPLFMAGFSPLSIILITILTGLPTAFGAVLGAALGDISNYFVGFCLSTAASSMLYITANQLIPEANKLYKGKLTYIFLLIGFICGSYLSFN